MRRYQRLLVAILLSTGAWFCLRYASTRLSINLEDPINTEGLSIVVMLTVALQGLGLVGIALSGTGVILSALLRPKPYNIRLLLFFSSNFLLLLHALLGIFLICFFALDTLASIAGLSLYIGVIGFALSATPKRIADQ